MTLDERLQQMQKQTEQLQDHYLRSLGALQLLNELESEGYELCKPEQPEQSEEES